MNKTNKKKTKVVKNTSYTKEEWAKIEELAFQKGKTCKSAKSAKKHLDSL